MNHKYAYERSRRGRASLTQAALCLGAALAIAALAPLAMLRAAEPESAKTEATKPKNDSPAADSPPAKQQAKGEGGVEAPLEQNQPDVKELWNLTLEAAVQTGLANSKVLRNVGGLLLKPDAPKPDQKKVAATDDAEGPREDSKSVRGEKVRLILAQTMASVAPADFKAAIRNTVSDIERAYWELYFNYRTLNAEQAGCDSALQTWRKVHTLFESGAKGGEAEREAQSREQYFLFRARVENALASLNTAEGQLRYMLGLGAADGRRIKPADEPATAEVRFDWVDIRTQALNRNADLPPEQELELLRALAGAVRDLDRNYQVSRTTFNRRVAAAKQVEAVTATYESGAATLDMLLDAQRRLSEAEISYHRALVDYNLSIVQFHYRRGSLLEYNGILLAEGVQGDQPPIDPFAPRKPVD
ncbi:MAG TPA: TolC family protein [Pirellulales bacterium]